MCIVCPGLNTNPGVSCLASSLALLSSLAAALSSLSLLSSFPSNHGCAARREACVTKKQARSSRIKNRLTTQRSRFTAPPVIPACRDGRAVGRKVESTTRANDYKHEGVLQSLRVVKYLL